MSYIIHYPRQILRYRKLLFRDLDLASDREFADDHLPDTERADLVARYRRWFPDEAANLPAGLTDAYLEIIY